MNLEASGFFLSNVLLLGVAFVGFLVSIVSSELLDSWLSAEYLVFVLILKVVLWEVRVNYFTVFLGEVHLSDDLTSVLSFLRRAS